jgi:hypothetical protein
MHIRCIAIGRNCLPFRITRVHFSLFVSLCCSCAFVIFCVISVGYWFVSVLPWFIFCLRLLFFYNPSECLEGPWDIMITTEKTQSNCKEELWFKIYLILQKSCLWGPLQCKVLCLHSEIGWFRGWLRVGCFVWSLPNPVRHNITEILLTLNSMYLYTVYIFFNVIIWC